MGKNLGKMGKKSDDLCLNPHYPEGYELLSILRRSHFGLRRCSTHGSSIRSTRTIDEDVTLCSSEQTLNVSVLDLAVSHGREFNQF